ncbi:hypothetical protein GW17_00036167, partial [Ensete ventricosum]
MSPSPHAGRRFFTPRGEKKSLAGRRRIARAILRPPVKKSLTGDESMGQFFAHKRRIARGKSSGSMFVFSHFFFPPPSADTARNRLPTVEIARYRSISGGNRAKTPRSMVPPNSEWSAYRSAGIPICITDTGQYTSKRQSKVSCTSTYFGVL